jgi:beta-lactamase class A
MAFFLQYDPRGASGLRAVQNRVQVLMARDSLRREIERIATDAGAAAVAVALHDFEHRTGWSLEAERWFHAASTIKVAVLLGLHAAIADGLLDARSRLHVRNRFLSVADGRPFRVDSAREASTEVHQSRGRTRTVSELAEQMIVSSSNLATNLLVDLLGIEYLQEVLDRHAITGIELRRGVEDERAWERGINNRVTADGLLQILRLIASGQAVSEDASQAMMETLLQQRFRSGIPAGLPDDARVAHKTGEISSVAHDAAIILLPGRGPVALVVLTEWEEETTGRQRAIADITRAVYRALLEPAAADGDE